LNLNLFDFDCNLTHPDLEEEAKELIEHAKQVGIQQMLVPGATLVDSRQSISLCEQYPNVLFPTAGVHPYHAHLSPTEEEIKELKCLALFDQVVAIGECGLDYSKGFPDKKKQQEWFKVQIEIACELQKPLFLHERLAHEDFLNLLFCHRQLPPIVIHCFTGNEKELMTYIEKDFYIGLTGFFLRKKKEGEEIRRLVPKIPFNRLVLETDAPYMGFKKCRRLEPKHSTKQYPNVPSALLEIVNQIANILKKTPLEIAHQTTANARRFLRLPPV
jgi:TatD DNase family protein